MVEPGQPLAGRLSGALALPRRIREDSERGRAAVAGLRAGTVPRIAVFGDRPLDPTGDSASHRLGNLLRLAMADGWLVSFHSSRQWCWYDVDRELRLTPAEAPASVRVAWVVRPEAAAAVMPALTALRPGIRVVHRPRVDEPPPAAARSGLLFVGNFTHAPNVDAVDVLVREVMPRLWKRRPELVLQVAGRGLETAAVDDRIRILGFVNDLDALVDGSSALVAPLRFGAGLKGKVGYALARGLPVVTTDVGAEGFPAGDGMLVVENGDWDAFASRTLELLDREEIWRAASAAGIGLTRREFSPEVVAPMLRRILAA